MAPKLRVLIDINVILDVLQRREPHYPASARVLALAEIGQVEGLIAATTVTTIFYLIARDQSPDRARSALSDLLRFLKVATVSHETVEGALGLPYQDFEDAVQMMSAVQEQAQYVISRDVKGYRAGPLPALQPSEVLALIRPDM